MLRPCAFVPCPRVLRACAWPAVGGRARQLLPSRSRRGAHGSHRVAGAGACGRCRGDGRAVRQSTLAAQMPGRILSLAVDAGDRISKGQVLVRIDPAEAAARWRRLKPASPRRRRRSRMRARNTRVRAAVERKFLSQSALDGAHPVRGRRGAVARGPRQRGTGCHGEGVCRGGFAARWPGRRPPHRSRRDGPARAQPAHRL